MNGTEGRGKEQAVFPISREQARVLVELAAKAKQVGELLVRSFVISAERYELFLRPLKAPLTVEEIKLKLREKGLPALSGRELAELLPRGKNGALRVPGRLVRHHPQIEEAKPDLIGDDNFSGSRALVGEEAK